MKTAEEIKSERTRLFKEMTALPQIEDNVPKYRKFRAMIAALNWVLLDSEIVGIDKLIDQNP